MIDPVSLGLPHREPFIFIDEIVEHTPGESALALKTFPASTPFFAGHFPGRPIVPGVILTEALAQTAGIAAGQGGRSFLLSAIRSMKFPNAALPDEEIMLSAKKIGAFGPLWQFEVRATVAERVVGAGTVIDVIPVPSVGSAIEVASKPAGSGTNASTKTVIGEAVGFTTVTNVRKSDGNVATGNTSETIITCPVGVGTKFVFARRSWGSN